MRFPKSLCLGITGRPQEPGATVLGLVPSCEDGTKTVDLSSSSEAVAIPHSQCDKTCESLFRRAAVTAGRFGTG